MQVTNREYKQVLEQFKEKEDAYKKSFSKNCYYKNLKKKLFVIINF